MDNYFCFAGKRSTDFGVFVERFPTQEKPIRQVELVSVPGRNGSLRLDKLRKCCGRVRVLLQGRPGQNVGDR